MDQWYLLYCKPKQEQRALDNLKLQGIESYFPTFSHSKIVRGKRTTSEKPLFPNYLFVKLNSSCGPFSKVKNTRGVSCFVMAGVTYQLVPDVIVAKTKQMSAQVHIDELPKAGEHIQINNGSYKGLEAIFLEPDGDKRSVLLLKLLNQDVKMVLSNDAFSKLAVA
jgi:transcriptional antiterminator RfaH